MIDQFRRAAGYVDRILKARNLGRPAGRSADQVRADHQLKTARALRSADAARPRQRGDRVRHVKGRLLRCMS